MTALKLSPRATALTLPARDAALALDARGVALVLAARGGPYAPALLTLEDLSGHWLFENGDRIVWEAGDTGEALTPAARPATLTLEPD